MCPKCQGFRQREKIERPNDLYHLVRQLEVIVAEGTLTLIGGNCKLSDIQKEKPWPEDYVEQTFACTSCEQKFKLAAETYHGSGGEWATI